ncbi:MAG: phenylalanyl-tRNA synthetase beta chain [Solirubrobacterales bacterium]|jgi:phenylalanyl-tRNA synthetase beta chain|nr:phenylalanyl-tRNA synthetase beta chain [Solirubrobacterales bacterium]
MKVPFSWLTSYCDPGLAPEEVAELLSLKAVEVERVSRVGVPATEGFVVGLVKSAGKHPDADRLSVCEVDDGDGTRTIVCGAPNVAAGQTVAVARPGAVMPDGTKLKRAKLRGVESDGMILSERELELSDEHEGIMVLETTALPGTPLSDVLQTADAVLELDLNPNRVDCMGVYGVARELHAITGAELAPAPWEEGEVDAAGEGSVEDLASVVVEVPELCPRFSARAFTDVTMGPSPAWLKARLAAAGQRPISNVVDITNYVMLMTAQPLHAFDLDKVPGGEIIVRTAGEGERMTTLDGVERGFDAETVLVCDRERPTGIAGIMGGQVSEVSDATTRVLLEVATWNGANILRTSAMLGLRSEASARNEKGLHPELALRAQRIASRLLVELCGARLVPGTIDVAADIPAAHVISLHGSRLDSLLGIELERSESEHHLRGLGFEVESAGDADLTATVPFHRHYDVTREVDLIEEVGRLHGLDRLPRTLPGHPERVGGLSREQSIRRRAEDVLRDLGFDEVVAWAFVDPGLADRLRLPPDDPRRAAVATQNPISAEHALMRTTLLGGLLDAARHNLARGAERVALFESGRAYLAEPPPAQGGPLTGQFSGKLPPPVREPHRLAGLVVGELTPPSWVGGAAPADAAGFYRLKGVIELLAAELGTGLALTPHPEPFLHPGRAAAAGFGGTRAGWLGELHPLVSRAWDLPSAVAFELDLAPLAAAAGIGNETYDDVTTHPAVLQDLAVTVADDVSAERVRDAVRAGGGSLLERAEIFDVYRGEQLEKGTKSLALRLEFRAPDRTLTDEAVAAQRERIKEALAEIGGAIRE